MQRELDIMIFGKEFRSPEVHEMVRHDLEYFMGVIHKGGIIRKA